MNAVIMPGYLEWIIVVNPTKEVVRKEPPGMVSKWMYDPWPNASKTGIVEMELPGYTLRELLNALSSQYQRVNVDFHPINRKSNGLDFDYDVFVNNKHLSTRPEGLETKLSNDDEVKVRFLLRWDG